MKVITGGFDDANLPPEARAAISNAMRHASQAGNATYAAEINAGAATLSSRVDRPMRRIAR